MSADAAMRRLLRSATLLLARHTLRCHVDCRHATRFAQVIKARAMMLYYAIDVAAT